MMAKLHELGWNERLQGELERLKAPDLQPARVSVEHRIHYEVLSATGSSWVELGGRQRHLSGGRLELPAVGDWVAIRDGRIEAVLPRHSVFVRKAVRARDEPQIIAANIDVVFVVTSANKEFNPRRIERYVAAVMQSGASPVLVLNKVDLCEAPEALLESLGGLRSGLPIACVSALERRGKEVLLQHLGGNATVALVGMSGTGKSSIANWLVGREALATGAIAAHGDLGKHTTSHRELFALPGGGALIDTPGMRELGLWMDTPDLLTSFPEITKLAQGCRFGDCQHSGEPGCAVLSAIASGELGAERVQRFHELRQNLSARAGATADGRGATAGAPPAPGRRRKHKRG